MIEITKFSIIDDCVKISLSHKISGKISHNNIEKTIINHNEITFPYDYQNKKRS